ncbi:MAG: hypothetical protein NTZ35_20135 [Ignavibacteriales bacterium]|nr:hypothetical protein [Ignavibacteriales bacterium]
MNWRLIISLSLLGIIFGIASVFGFTSGREWLAWLCIGIFSAWRFSRRSREELFLHGFYLGILTGFFSSIIQALFVSTYLANNPRMVEALNALPQGLHPAAIVLIMGPIIGTVSGVVFGVLAVIIGKVMHRNL